MFRSCACWSAGFWCHNGAVVGALKSATLAIYLTEPRVRGWQTVSWCSCGADVPDCLHTIYAVATALYGCAAPHETPSTDCASSITQDGRGDRDTPSSDMVFTTDGRRELSMRLAHCCAHLMSVYTSFMQSLSAAVWLLWMSTPSTVGAVARRQVTAAAAVHRETDMTPALQHVGARQHGRPIGKVSNAALSRVSSLTFLTRKTLHHTGALFCTRPCGDTDFPVTMCMASKQQCLALSSQAALLVGVSASSILPAGSGATAMHPICKATAAWQQTCPQQWQQQRQIISAGVQLPFAFDVRGKLAKGVFADPDALKD